MLNCVADFAVFHCVTASHLPIYAVAPVGAYVVHRTTRRSVLLRPASAEPDL